MSGVQVAAGHRKKLPCSLSDSMFFGTHPTEGRYDASVQLLQEKAMADILRTSKSLRAMFAVFVAAELDINSRF